MSYTGRMQTATTSSNQSSLNANDYVEVRDTNGKGMGTFATRTIASGTRIIAEAGLLQIDRKTSDAATIVQAFESLSSSRQSAYLSLHEFACDSFIRAAERELGQYWENTPKIHRRVLGIWAANSFGDVFLLGSRINHSCIPNVNFAYNSTLGKQTFHAVREIAAGEELTIMYNQGTNLLRNQRQTELREWGFTCGCPACEDMSKGEERRADLFGLDQQLAMYPKSHTPVKTYEYWKSALKMAQRMAAIQKSEGLLNRELGASYRDAAWYSAKLGNPKIALLWAEKELEVDAYCIGKDHPDYLEELQTVTQLRLAAESSQPFDCSTIDWFTTQEEDLPSTECTVM
ncbi:hypothetical protein WAI453_006501 [Rhynchosporium graminicola]